MSKGLARVAAANRPIDAGATDDADRTAHNSPTLVANPLDPSKLAVANRTDLPAPACAMHVSSDGGANWSTTMLPKPPGASSIACFSPDMAYGADGTLYVAFTSFTSVLGSAEEASSAPDAVWLVRSTDEGRTFAAPVQVAGRLAFQVRITADPMHAARLYVAWVQGSRISGWGFGQDGNPIVLSHSEDFGSTWMAPVTVSPPARRRVVAPSLAVDRAGAPLIAYIDVGDDGLDYSGEHGGRGGEPYRGRWSLLMGRSPDHGNTWTESVVDDGVIPVRRFLVLYPPAPSVAVDRGSGRVYVGFHDGRLGDADVWVWASSDAGVRWSGARRVNDTIPHDRRSQYLPRLATAPDGRLDVIYYDRRADDRDVANEVSFQSSFDGGKTFRPSVVIVDRPSDSRVGLGSDRGMAELGDRLGLISTDAGALAVWTDTRGGTEASVKQDLASTVIAVSPPNRLRRPLGVIGLALAVAGVAVALWRLRVAVRRRNRK